MVKTIETIILFIGLVVLVTILSQEAPKLTESLQNKLNVAAQVK